MKKAIIGVIAAAAAGGAWAQSSTVTLYGIASSDVVSVNNVVGAGGATKSQTRIDSGALSASRLGFRGKEDLGDGLSAIFTLEAGVNLDDGQTAMGRTFGRGAFVGLDGRFGTATVGRQWNLNDDLMCGFFICGGFAAFRYTEFDWLSDLTNNTVKYWSPSVGGLKVGALYSAGESTTSSNGGRTVEGALGYDAGPFSAGATIHEGKNADASRTDRLWSLGASYKLGAVKLRGAFANSKTESLSLPTATTWDAGADWAVAPQWRLSLDHVARNQKGTKNDSYFDRLIVVYQLSKRTDINANLVRMNNSGTASERFYGNGKAGVDQRVIALGMTHTF
ncbi:porin [Derxia gummosa]|uniref:Porin n=1 Tax=Derxia gummosa DSM 723 TaxID=1121388 RepID=A0A8B6X121_9BURK|nr:porin [Derxia gummosa]